jgi:hypothetical protein
VIGRSLLRLAFLSLALGCAATGGDVAPGARVARLGASDEAIADVRDLFVRRNPGYDLESRAALRELDESLVSRVVFVQAGEASVEIGRSRAASPVRVGDAILLRRGESLSCEPPIGALVFTVPDDFPAALPRVIRPDFDPRLTDTPGGCATEKDAYRRLLLTWRLENGPYVYRALNAHRVRIDDSFTHYHPVRGGFDEFYLVQALLPGGRLLTCDATARIEGETGITREESPGLFSRRTLAEGDLVYLPRGVAHRGLGGALVMVITVPGFVPGAEIGLDHHLRAINERLGLEGENALPLNGAASIGPVKR